MARVTAVHDVTNFQPDQIATAQLAVDCEIEHRQLTGSVLDLQPNPDGPDFL